MTAMASFCMRANACLAHARSHPHGVNLWVLPTAAFITASVAYSVAANASAAFQPGEGVGFMAPMWASFFASWSLLAAFAVSRVSGRGAEQSSRLRWSLALTFVAVQPAALLCAFVGLAGLGDAHGAVWSAFALVFPTVMPFIDPSATRAVLSFCRRASSHTAKGDGASSSHAPPLVVTVQEHPSADERGGEGDAEPLSPKPASAQQAAPTGGCARCGTRAARCLKATCSWTFLVLYLIVLIGFAIQAPLRLAEVRAYPPTARLLPLAVFDASLPGSASPPSSALASVTARIALHCTGTAAPGRPLIAFEAGGGTGALSFARIQDSLATLGWRSCAIDRPGYGDSDSVPLGAVSAVDTRRRLAQALVDAGEALPEASGPTPLVLVGHSAGVQIAQVFALGANNSVLPPSDATHGRGPARRFFIVGMALLDGYPDYLRLLRYSPAELDADNVRVCAALQAARAFEAVALTRAVTGWVSSSFKPASLAARYAASYSSGHLWRAQFVDYCTAAGGHDGGGALLQAAANSLGVVPPNAANGIAWPPAPVGAAVIVIPAGSTVSSAMYWNQAVAYNATLAAPGQASLVVCEGCSHGFVYERPEWVAETMHSFLTSRLGPGV